MKDKRELLKIKLKSLAEEARIIKHAEGVRRQRGRRARQRALMKAWKARQVTKPAACEAVALFSKDWEADWEAAKKEVHAWREQTRDVRKELRDAVGVPAPDEMREAMHLHRIHVVRVEARATLLAYCILRGRKYTEVEPAPRSVAGFSARVERVVRMLTQYGGEWGCGDVKARVLAWFAGTVHESLDRVS